MPILAFSMPSIVTDAWETRWMTLRMGTGFGFFAAKISSLRTFGRPKIFSRYPWLAKTNSKNSPKYSHSQMFMSATIFNNRSLSERA